MIRLLSGDQPYAVPMTNSACYSPISTNTASWATVVYGYDASTGSMKAVLGSSGAATMATQESYTDMFDWANSLFADTFA